MTHEFSLDADMDGWDAAPQRLPVQTSMAVSQPGATLSPVARLPPEILSYVFCFAADDIRPIPGVNKAVRDDVAHGDRDLELSEPGWLINRLGSLGWIELGHVCRSWHEAVHGLPALWAKDIGALPHALEYMMSRVGGYGSIIVRVYGSSFRGDAELVWNQLNTVHSGLRPRITGIICTETRPDALLSNGCCTFLEEGAFPRLEHISIFANESEWEPDEGDDVPHFDTPGLRTLVVTNVTCFTTAAALTVLDLTVVECPVDPSAWFIHAVHLRSILRLYQATLLELRLNIVVLHLDDHYVNHPRIDFEVLERIEYTDPFSLKRGVHPTVIFTWMTYPASTIVSVEVEAPTYFAPLQTTFIMTALRLAGTPSATAIYVSKRPSVERPGRTSVVLHLCRAAPIDTGKPDPYTSNESTVQFLTLKIHVRNRQGVTARVIAAFGQELHTPSVRALKFSGLTLLDLEQLISAFNAVEFLGLQASTINSIVNRLCHRNNDGRLPFPRMRALCLSCDPQSQDAVSSSEEKIITLSARVLVEGLAARVGISHPPLGNAPDLQDVRITHLRVDGGVMVDPEEEQYVSLVEDLHGLVGNVDWRPYIS